MPRHPAKISVTDGYDAVPAVQLAPPTDALAAPDSDSLISSALTFWPQGAIWGTPDGQAISLSSVLARFTRVLMSPFEWLYARAFRLALEASAQTAGETLDDWERDHGLPEACFGPDQPTSRRIMALKRKVAAEAVCHPKDFVRLAADFGFTIEIEEPAIFRCGFSQCGGRHKVGSYIQETYVIVRIKGASVGFFRCGVSRVGKDPLFSLGETQQIACMLRKMLPAWVTPVIKPWRTFKVLTTETGAPITDEFGNPLLVRVS